MPAAKDSAASLLSSIRPFIHRALAVGLPVIALAAYLALAANPVWPQSADLHTVLEAQSALLALIAGVLALLRFYAKKNSTFLFVGVGFLGAAFFDAYHALLTNIHLVGYFPTALKPLVLWSWLASRIFLALLLCFGCYAAAREQRLGRAGRVRETGIYLIASAVVLGFALLFALAPLPPADTPDYPVPRGAELIAAALFLIGTIACARPGIADGLRFRWWLALALFLNFLCQAAAMPFSGELYDSFFYLAHLLKLASYAVVLAGLMISIKNLYSEEDARADAFKRLSDTHELTLATAGEGIFGIDGQARLTFANRAAAELCGWSELELAGQPYTAIVSEDSGAARAIRGTLRSAQFKRDGEADFRRRDGSFFNVAYTSSPILEADRVSGAVVTFSDITERKRVASELRRNEWTLRALYETTSSKRISLHHKFDGMLALGCQRFGLPIGIVSRIENRRYEVIAARAPGHAINKGDVFDLHDTYCHDVLLANAPIAFERAAGQGQREQKRYAEIKLETYIGAPVKVDGKVYGTIAFAGPKPRAPKFTESEKDILRLMAEWAGGELERASAAQVLAKEQDLLRAMLEHMEDGILGSDVDGRLCLHNRVAREFFGIAEAAGAEFRWGEGYDLFEADGKTPIADGERPVLRAHRGEYIRNHEIVVVRGKSIEHNVIVNGQPLRDRDGNQLGSVVMLHDITEQKRHEAQIVYLANHDALTGLPNRNLLQERLAHMLALAARSRRQVAVLFIDLDHFKFINDSLGHAAGDEVLNLVAQRLSACTRKTDSVARIGGDEFVVALADSGNESDTPMVARKIIAALARPMPIGGRELLTSASIGVSLYPKDGQAIDVLLKNADSAMYRAKEVGRNNFQFYSPEMNALLLERLELESSLRRALDQREFLLHFQPQIDLVSGEIHGVEALVRWQRNNQLIPPSKFISLAEQTGLIIPIGEWVLQNACAQAVRWQRLRPLRIAVNISAVQFRQADFGATVARILDETGLAACCLELEITEGLLLERTSATSELLAQLKTMGVRIAIDDFGTGYSSLSYLKDFPLDVLKIDQSFVRNIGADPNAAAIAKAVIALAGSLNFEAVAEGVETGEQLSFLRAQGCVAAQGFLFSKPVTAAMMTALLASENFGAASSPVADTG